jgi:hypothetical protein
VEKVVDFVLTLELTSPKVEVLTMEQRKQQRFELHLPFDLELLRSQTKIVGRTNNVSGKGVLFPFSTAFQAGDKVAYSLTLPQETGSPARVRVHCTGIVLRSAQEGVAVSLDEYEMVREMAASAAA